MSIHNREQLEKEFEQSSREMERLMEQMPRINALNETWKKSRDAEELLEAFRTYRRLEKELSRMHEEEQQYARSGKTGMSAYIQNQMGYRQGPLNEARAKWLQLKENSVFGSAEEAEEWLDSCQDSAEAERTIQDYKAEYNRVLQTCRELDRQLSALEE